MTSIVDTGGWEAPIARADLSVGTGVAVPSRRAVMFPGVLQGLGSISQEDHERAVEMAQEAKAGRKRFFFIGNGGSAAIASHMSADWLKNIGVATICFNDPAMMTCITNDCGYEEVFARPLRVHGQRGDLLFAISSSGRSKSITNAVDVAVGLGMKVITLSGFLHDNRLRGMGDVNFYVPASYYGTVEVVHHAICHSILDAVKRC